MDECPYCAARAKELAGLAIESMRRDIELAKIEQEVLLLRAFVESLRTPADHLPDVGKMV